MRTVQTALVMLVLLGLVSLASAADQVGTSFPSDFPVIKDASLGVPVIGFGAAGRVTRTPVVFLHGNNDTPFPTACIPSATSIRWRNSLPTTAMR